jgi:hypothetical protein
MKTKMCPTKTNKRPAMLKPPKQDTFANSIPGPKATTQEIREWIRCYFKEKAEMIDSELSKKIDKSISSIWWEEDDVWVLEESEFRKDMCDFVLPIQFRECLIRKIIKTRNVSY